MGFKTVPIIVRLARWELQGGGCLAGGGGGTNKSWCRVINLSGVDR